MLPTDAPFVEAQTQSWHLCLNEMDSPSFMQLLQKMPKLKRFIFSLDNWRSRVLHDPEKFQELGSFALEQLEISYFAPINNYDGSSLMPNITLPTTLKTLSIKIFLYKRSNSHDPSLTLFTRIQALPQLLELTCNVEQDFDVGQKSENAYKIFFQNLPISLTKLRCTLLQAEFINFSTEDFQQLWSNLAKCERLAEFELTIFFQRYGLAMSPFTIPILIKGDESVKLPSIEYFHITSLSNPLDYESILSMLDKKKLKSISIASNKYFKEIDAKWLFAKIQVFENIRYLALKWIPIGEIDQSVYEAIRDCLLKLRLLQYVDLILEISKCVDPIIISMELTEIFRRRNLKKAMMVAQNSWNNGSRERLNSLNKSTEMHSSID